MPGDGRAQPLPGSVRGPLPTRPQRRTRTLARTPLGACHLCLCTAPDSPVQRGAEGGQVSRQQVSPSKTRVLRCPTFLPRVGLPLRLWLPLPLPPLSVLLAAALAPLSGLRHSAPALGRWDSREVQKAQERPLLSGAKLRPPPPAAPVPERCACLIGGHTLRGRGAESLNSSPPTGRPQPSSPPPPPHPLKLQKGGWASGSSLQLPPWTHRAREPARRDRRPSRVLPTSFLAREGARAGLGA